MKVKSIRFTHGKTSSGSFMTMDDKPFSFLIEDEPRTVKVNGETRIPAGTYKLGIRKEITPLTKKCRELPSYKGWFEYFIEVLNVPNFSGIYFHILNKENETEGCQGPNYECVVEDGELSGRRSTEATKEFYRIVYPLLENGEEVLYEVVDADK